METLILALHVIVCVVLVILVLLQAGKEGMGVIFGGGNSSVFGSSGAGGLLAKLTAFMAIIFAGTCLSYNLLTGSNVKKESTILDVRMEDTMPMPAPVTPPATPVPANPEPEQAAPAPEQAPSNEVPPSVPSQPENSAKN